MAGNPGTTSRKEGRQLTTAVMNTTRRLFILKTDRQRKSAKSLKDHTESKFDNNFKEEAIL